MRKAANQVEALRRLLQKYRELLLYLIFGVLTTAVNYLAWWVLAPFFETSTVPVAAAWILSVLFAYLTNRKFVFDSRVTGGRALLLEMGSFFAARALSGVLDLCFMWIFADWLGFDSRIVKLLSNVFVVIFNYVASKLVIFRKKGPSETGR